MAEPDIAWYRIPGRDPEKFSGHFTPIAGALPKSCVVAAPFDTGLQRFAMPFPKAHTDAPKVFHKNDADVSMESRHSYLARCNRFIEACRSGNLNKAILSRRLFVPLQPEPELYFHALCQRYPAAYVSLVSSPLFGTWIGASPELLLKAEGSHIETMSLAGTRAVGSVEPFHQKEREEQAIVTRFIRDALNVAGATDVTLSEPYEHISGPVKHLRTDISAQLDGDPDKLLDVLHPTPAVCGYPKVHATRFIMEEEGYDRALYAGFLGVRQADDLITWVNLRCAQVVNQGVMLYVGGGITVESNAEDEWTETEHKARTLMAVFENQ
jgi:isochorismate synthase